MNLELSICKINKKNIKNKQNKTKQNKKQKTHKIVKMLAIQPCCIHMMSCSKWKKNVFSFKNALSFFLSFFLCFFFLSRKFSKTVINLILHLYLQKKKKKKKRNLTVPRELKSLKFWGKAPWWNAMTFILFYYFSKNSYMT